MTATPKSMPFAWNRRPDRRPATLLQEAYPRQRTVHQGSAGINALAAGFPASRIPVVNHDGEVWSGDDIE